MWIDEGRYRAGLQCAKRLWLSAVAGRPGEVSPVPDRAWLIRELRSGARELFPAPDVLFDQTLEFEGVRARVDVIEPLSGGGVGLRQVRATGRVRDTDIDALVLPLLVARALGLDVRSVEILAIDSSYVRAGRLRWPELLMRRDVTRDVEFLIEDVPGELSAMRGVLAGDRAPVIEPSPHCQRPRICPYFADCSREKPRDWLLRLPGLRPETFHALQAEGRERMRDVSEDTPLDGRQRRAVRAHARDGLIVERALAKRLRPTGPPTAYLDFETWNPAIPFLDGMSPHQRLPCQWSLHLLEEGGLTHRAFLQADGGDPRQPFAESLIDALADEDWPVLVYSGFEDEVLRELAAAFPELAAGLERIRARLFDLLPVVRELVYHPDFDGSFSLKRVASALSPAFSYEDLVGIRHGAGAADALGRLMRDELAPAEVTTTRDALLRYCERDTLALVELHRALRAATESV